ncbi:MAG: LptF/LptG family permease [Candidatus Omnitrophota bacterium]|nr:LptF/LptG family permease [Candidatus Omnitrophota bacterium]
MRILEKYVLGNFVAALFFCITLLMVLGIIGDILGFLDDIFRNNIPLQSILSFYLYLAPFAFVNMLPFACLLSAVYVFNSLSKNHEVTAVVASGLSLWKLLRPVLLVTFVLCLFAFIINDRIVPSTMEKANRIRKEELEFGEGKKRFEIKDLAVYGKGDRIIYAKSYVPSTKTLNNVIIHKQDRQHNVIEKVNARSVKWQDDGSWMGRDVIVFKADPAGDFTGNPEIYRRKRIFIMETPDDFLNNQWDPRFMSFGQLSRYLRVFHVGSPATIRRLRVDLNYKLAFPFTALITVLIGVPFSIETGRASALIGMVKGITVAIFYLPVMAISLALGKGGLLPPVAAAWFSNVTFAIAGIYFVNRKS